MVIVPSEPFEVYVVYRDSEMWETESGVEGPFPVVAIECDETDKENLSGITYLVQRDGLLQWESQWHEDYMVYNDRGRAEEMADHVRARESASSSSAAPTSR